MWGGGWAIIGTAHHRAHIIASRHERHGRSRVFSSEWQSGVVIEGGAVGVAERERARARASVRV